MKFTNAMLNEIKTLPENSYLKETPEKKYEDFAKVDPFPRINESLLNSADVVRYILTTGMVDPFLPENLTGATYTCDFSGAYTYWDDEKIQKKGSLINPDDELILPPNSITFLEIEPDFRIPEYMVLRFNLQVRNVYKGLLLGTGPIVDPGFVGKLFIPLHNLTSNEYVIKKNAHLISVEFTKLSSNPKWALSGDKRLKDIVNNLDFTSVPYIPETIKTNRSIDEYITKALQKNTNFCKKDPQSVYVNSSMQALKKNTEDTIDKMTQMSKDVEKSFNKVENRENFLRYMSILTVLGMMISIVSLCIAAGWYFSKAAELTEATKLIEQQTVAYEQQTEFYEQDKGNLNRIITELENRVKKLEDKGSLGDKP